MSAEKQKRVKAQKVYHNGTGKFKDTVHTGWQLPADAASYFKIHDQMTWAMDVVCAKENQGNYWNRSYVTAALAAIGIKGVSK